MPWMQVDWACRSVNVEEQKAVVSESNLFGRAGRGTGRGQCWRLALVLLYKHAYTGPLRLRVVQCWRYHN